MKYIQHFLIGSSILVTAPFLYVFNKIKKPDYSYFNYSILAPIWFGLWNIIALIIGNYFNLSLRLRLFIISLISCCLIVLFARFKNVYDFTPNQWFKYYISILSFYLFIWNIVIFHIEKMIS